MQNAIGAFCWFWKYITFRYLALCEKQRYSRSFSLRSLQILCCAKLRFRAYSYRGGSENGEKGRKGERERNIYKQVSVELMRLLCDSA